MTKITILHSSQNNSPANFSGVFHILRKVCFFSVIIFLSLFFTTKVEASSFQHVLLLQSYHHGHPWEDDVTRSIKKTLQESEKKVRLTIQYMDTKRAKSSRHYQNLISLYAEKFKNDTFDLIIANDDNALFFALDHRKKLFDDAPIVFCGLSHNPVERLKTEEKVTGIVQFLEFKKTFQLAIKLNPKISRFIVINDRTSSGAKRTPQIKKALSELSCDIPYTFYDDLSIDSLRQILLSADPDAALFIHLFNRDNTGKTFSNAEIFDIIKSSFNGPIYAVKKNYIEYGIIGGVLSDGELHGAKAATIALEILAGKKADDCPLIMDNIDLPTFFYPQLEKYNIAESNLPENSRVFSRPFSFYQAYKVRIFLIVAIIILLLLAIGFLTLNIIARRRASRELLLLRNYLSNIIDSMPSTIVGVNVDGTVTQWNNNAEQTTGIMAANAIGKQLPQVFPRLADEMSRVQEAIHTRQTLFSHKQLRPEGKETCYEDVTIYPLIANGVEGVVIRIDDVTERTRMEEMMVQTEKMLSVGGLAAGMAHEINNPLSIITQSSQNAVRRLSPTLAANQEVAEELGIDLQKMDKYLHARGILSFLGNIETAVNRSSEIIKNMLSFSSTNASQREICSISKIIQEAILLARSEYSLKKKHDFRNIKIAIDLPEDLPQISVNRVEIQQVIFNLLKNSGQAMNDISRDDYQPKITLTASADQNVLTLKMEDNGPGIPDAIQAHIFDPFFTTKEPGSGTGLGLSVSYFIIVKRHHGEFRVESEEGRGTIFSITLPRGN